ncbi:MAG: hypothetical protein RLZZ67_391 [Candidatus Parcubacteria bacterium]|jgi:hypothetical protein
MKTIIILDPKSTALPPLWWSLMGELVWIPTTSNQEVLKFATGKTRERASGHFTVSKERLKDMWSIDWHIFSKNGEFEGSIILLTAELLTAFGLLQTNVEPTNDEEFCAKHCADVGIPGKFIRQDVYLNVPCPKAEHVGDPNFSIKITPFVLTKVQRFVEKHL